MNNGRMRLPTRDGPLAVIVLPPASNTSVASEHLVFLHPTNLDSNCWLPVAARLSGHWRVLIDSRGHGDSHRQGPFHIADYARDVQHVIEELALDRVHLIGGSLGGSIACAVASYVPGKVASICAVGGALEPADVSILTEIDELFRSGVALEEIFGAVMAREIEAGLSAQLAEDALVQVGIGRRTRELIHRITLNAFSEDGRVYASGVACPVIVINGERDTSCPPEAGERMASALRGKFELLPGIGHLAMLQAPDAIAAHVSAALSHQPPFKREIA